MFFWSTTASDSDLASTYRQCRYPLFAISGYPDVSLRKRVTATVRSCFATLRQIRSVRRCLPQHALLTLIRALVPARSTTAAPCWSVSPVIYTRQAAVHPQRCRPTRVLSQGLRTHHPASPQPSLVAGPGTDSIPSLRSGIPMSQWISAAISR